MPILPVPPIGSADPAVQSGCHRADNENYAMNIIRHIYKLNPDEEGMTYELYEHCSGDINDRKKG